MADEAEIVPNNTIPALPPLPGAGPLMHNPHAGDDQKWPLANTGTSVTTIATPQPWQRIF
jgi:hypothetical protein